MSSPFPSSRKPKRETESSSNQNLLRVMKQTSQSSGNLSARRTLAQVPPSSHPLRTPRKIQKGATSLSPRVGGHHGPSRKKCSSTLFATDLETVKLALKNYLQKKNAGGKTKSLFQGVPRPRTAPTIPAVSDATPPPPSGSVTPQTAHLQRGGSNKHLLPSLKLERGPPSELPTSRMQRSSSLSGTPMQHALQIPQPSHQSTPHHETREEKLQSGMRQLIARNNQSRLENWNKEIAKTKQLLRARGIPAPEDCDKIDEQRRENFKRDFKNRLNHTIGFIRLNPEIHPITKSIARRKQFLHDIDSTIRRIEIEEMRPIMGNLALAVNSEEAQTLLCPEDGRTVPFVLKRKKYSYGTPHIGTGTTPNAMISNEKTVPRSISSKSNFRSLDDPEGSNLSASSTYNTTATFEDLQQRANTLLLKKRKKSWVLDKTAANASEIVSVLDMDSILSQARSQQREGNRGECFDLTLSESRGTKSNIVARENTPAEAQKRLKAEQLSDEQLKQTIKKLQQEHTRDLEAKMSSSKKQRSTFSTWFPGSLASKDNTSVDLCRPTHSSLTKSAGLQTLTFFEKDKSIDGRERVIEFGRQRDEQHEKYIQTGRSMLAKKMKDLREASSVDAKGSGRYPPIGLRTTNSPQAAFSSENDEDHWMCSPSRFSHVRSLEMSVERIQSRAFDKSNEQSTRPPKETTTTRSVSNLEVRPTVLHSLEVPPSYQGPHHEGGTVLVKVPDPRRIRQLVCAVPQAKSSSLTPVLNENRGLKGRLGGCSSSRSVLPFHQK